MYKPSSQHKSNPIVITIGLRVIRAWFIYKRAQIITIRQMLRQRRETQLGSQNHLYSRWQHQKNNCQ